MVVVYVVYVYGDMAVIVVVMCVIRLIMRDLRLLAIGMGCFFCGYVRLLVVGLGQFRCLDGYEGLLRLGQGAVFEGNMEVIF